MMTYDLMETMRNTNQWLGASASALGAYPAFAMFPNPALTWMQAWGEVTERTFQRMIVKPDWGINSIPLADGKDHIVETNIVMPGDFGDLVHFNVVGRKEQARKILLVAPMSGHYATLLRKTVLSLLPDCELYITDWHNARDLPVSAGKFDVEDYTLYLVDYLRHLGPHTTLLAVCQPPPLPLPPPDPYPA